MSTKAKNTITIEYDYNFVMIGIVSTLPEYKIAWELNRILQQRFIRKPDIILNFKDGELCLINYQAGKGNLQLELLKNKGELLNNSNIKYLLPDFNKFDYFLKITGFSEREIIDKLRNAGTFDYLQLLNISDSKHKENLIY